MSALETLRHNLALAHRNLPLVRITGTVSEIAPTHYRVRGLSPFVHIGEIVTLGAEADGRIGEVVHIDDAAVTVKPFQAVASGGIGMPASLAGPLLIHPHAGWKGRVLDALSRPIDDSGALPSGDLGVPVDGSPVTALRRARVNKPARTGVRVIDAFVPVCAGQRIGVFAGSGVGKSTLLSMLARARGFDTVVLALVGERGREVREFLEDALKGDRSNVVAVIATGDESAAMRRLAPKTAMTIAEFFRDRGESVLLIMDSVTRYAHAAREVALSAGEPAVARGYAPSVFSDLPKLLERAGPGAVDSGFITGVFAVLVDGDDHNEPVADAIRGTLDGHIVLDRAIADEGRYPAVNVLASVSRLADQVWTPEERELVLKLRSMIARFEETRDLRLMGGYQAGQDPELDKAIAFVPKIYRCMMQMPGTTSADAFKELAAALHAE
jgi:flagellum-specific ATP synthase